MNEGIKQSKNSVESDSMVQWFNSSIKTYIVIFYFISTTFLLSQDRPPYEIPTPSPCNYFQEELGFCINVNWSTERKFKKIIIDQCAYWIIYHDRICVSQQPGYENLYQINVVGIVEKGTNCENLSNTQVLLKFYNIIYNEIFLEQPDWYPWHNGALGEERITVPTFTSAGCYQSDSLNNIVLNSFFEPQPCDDNQYCCERFLWFSKINNTLRIDSTNQQNELQEYVLSKIGDTTKVYCETPCISECVKPLRTYNISSCYNDTCSVVDSTLWVIKKSSIPLIQCPGCSVIINYKARRSNYCPAMGDSTYNDIVVDNFELDCPFSADSIENFVDSLCMSSYPLNEIYFLTLDYLIKNGFVTYPENGKTSSYYRIYKSSCIADFFSEGFEGWPSRRVFTECGVENCCFMKIKMMTDYSGNRTYEIISSGSTSFQCLAPYGCYFHCVPINN
jgi:hypothetical protein